ncbi:MAG: hypothetical protein ABJN40_05485 [Sneathiella sp.]
MTAITAARPSKKAPAIAPSTMRFAGQTGIRMPRKSNGITPGRTPPDPFHSTAPYRLASAAPGLPFAVLDLKQMKKMDFQRINAAALAAYPGLLRSWMPGGRIRGSEYIALNPTRKDTTEGSFSVNITTGKWGDFAMPGATGGDPISLFAYLMDVSMIDSAILLSKALGLQPESGVVIYDRPKERTITPILPVPPRGLATDVPRHKRLGTPSATWAYKDKDGQLLGYTCRFDQPDGSKEILPLTWCKAETGAEFWTWKGFPAPRPFYGLDRLGKARREQKDPPPILLVEGEKAADAAARLLPEFTALTWPGGSHGLNKADFGFLTREKVVIWPDADKAGMEAAELVQLLLPGTLVLLPDDSAPPGWDAADAEAEGWTTAEASEWVRKKMITATDIAPLPVPPAPKEDDQDIRVKPPFRILGYNRGLYYYLPESSSQIVELTAQAHNKLNLMQLAPLSHWDEWHPGRGGNIAWDLAANALMSASHRAGVFRAHEKRRGRGAWLDDGRTVLHLGDRLVVDGTALPVRSLDTDYTYENDTPLGIDQDKSATDIEAENFLNICKALQWDRPLSALALAGWCVIAPLCGVLTWRPHIWITGPAGSGKTTVIRDIIGRVVGPIALQVESKTTEAGIRAELGFDARPIIFDEAEAEDERAGRRMQGNLDLARVASSESGGIMYKGSSSGKSIAYRIRSCFCFSSINTSVQHHADETRVTLLVLSKILANTHQQRADNEAHFNELMIRILDCLTPEFSSALMMRTVSSLPVLLQNIETFARAASLVLGSRRVGDQLGPLLAGAWHCQSREPVEMEAAVAWIRDHDFSEHTPDTSRADENRLLQYIVECVLRVTTGNGTTVERSVGEIIGIALGNPDFSLSPDIAQKTLRRHGIRIGAPGDSLHKPTVVFFSTTSEALRRLLKGTSWSANWRRPLLSLQGANPSRTNIRFTPALSTPAVSLPVALFE